MHRSGHAASLRVLLSGPAADELAPELDDQSAVTMVRPVSNGKGLRLPSFVDVALHVVASSSSKELAGDIRSLRSLSDAPLILAAYGEPNGIVDAGLSVGAADVIVLPQPVETLLFALRKASLNNGGAGGGKVVTVFSPKGGSGKTVLATNIAVAAARSGVNTLLVDLDLQFGDAALALAVPPRATIADLAGSSGDIDAEKLSAFVCTEPKTSLSLLAAPKRPEEAQILGQAELGAVLDAARSTYGAVVIDTGPLFDGAVLAALDRTDQLLLVCNPEITSLKNVRIGLETLDRLGFSRDRVSIVANRLGSPGGVGRRGIEEALEAEISFELPDDPEVPAAINRATPAVLANDGGRFARAVSKLAAELFAEAPATAAVASKKRFALGGRR
jgi:MinD-like ATPase involved in chromosome partitioning or flagellar assembly